MFYIINFEKFCENYSHAKMFIPTDLFLLNISHFPTSWFSLESMLISQGSYYTLEDQPIMKFQVLYEMLGDSQILLMLSLYSF